MTLDLEKLENFFETLYNENMESPVIKYAIDKKLDKPKIFCLINNTFQVKKVLKQIEDVFFKTFGIECECVKTDVEDMLLLEKNSYCFHKGKLQYISLYSIIEETKTSIRTLYKTGSYVDAVITYNDEKFEYYKLKGNVYIQEDGRYGCGTRPRIELNLKVRLK